MEATMGSGNVLLSAAKENDLERVTSLLDLGADVNATDRNGNSALHMASSRGYTTVVSALLARNPDLSLTNELGKTALHRAVEEGHHSVAAALLTGGIDVQAKNQDGDTALHVCSKKGDVKMVEVLLAQGAEVDYADKRQNTSLSRACEAGHLPVVQALLARGADVNASNEENELPLHVAAGKGHTRIVETLLVRGAKVHAVDIYGNTPLHEAACVGSSSVFVTLLHAGADPFRENEQEFTPVAVMAEDKICAEELLNAVFRDRNRSSSKANMRQVLSIVASRPRPDEEKVTAEDAILELQHMLQRQSSQAGATATVDENEIEDIVMKHMDQDTGLLGLDAVIKSFYELRKYPTVGHKPEPPELRAIFKKATKSRKVLRTRLAKRLLRSLFDKSGSVEYTSQVPLSFRRSNQNWAESDVDVLLGSHGEDGNVIDEEGFVKVGMRVLFSKK